VCVDVHCHVHYLPADEMVTGIYRRDLEPNGRFASELTRATNQKQMQNVLECLTSVEQRLRDMDAMGVDVQAISVSPFQFMYSLDPELGRKTARATNENLAEIVQKHPRRFVALANVPLQAPDAAADELEYCVKTLGFRGVEIGTNVAGAEVSRGRDAFWARVQALDVMVFMHPNGFTGGERLADHYFINSIGNPLDSTVAVGYLVFDRDQLKHLVNLWGADHIVMGTDYPYDMGWYDPRGFVDGSSFLKDGDKAKILGLNAAKLLKIKTRALR